MGRKRNSGDTDHLLEEGDALGSSEEDLGGESEGEERGEAVEGEEERHLEDLELVHGPRYACGLGRCRPRWLQIFARANFFTFFLCLNTLVEGAIVSGFTPVVLSSIEKRYRFSSTAAGMIIGVYNLVVLIAVIFLSYFGERAHKPRWLGVSLIIQGVGALVFATPEFFFRKYKVGQGAEFHLESCKDDNYTNSSDCEAGNALAYCIFIIGNITIGVGAASLYTIGTSYLDDIIYPKKVSLHLGVFYAMAVVGPAIGYGLGGLFLSINVDPWESTNLEQHDPGWVGAWWMCFVLSGIASLLLAVPFLMYPRLLPDSHLVLKARREEMAVEYRSKYGEEKKLKVLIKAFPVHLKKLFTNWPWVTLTFSITVLFFAFDGMVAFGPKYIETVMKLSASVTSVTLGAIAIPAGAAGVITGGLIVYCLKSKPKRAALVSVIVNTALIPITFIFLVYCSSSVVIGINSDYPGGNGGQDLSAPCNEGCNCTSTIFEPVCGADGRTYFSPCRAGCRENEESEDVVLEDCTCIAVGFLPPNTSLATRPDLLLNSTATNGRCDEECTAKLVGFLFGLFFFLFLIFVMKVPSIVITLRCVAEEQRTFSLGMQSTIVRLLGSVPAPLVFGAMFDSACEYWQYECGRRGNCWAYDSQNVATRAFAISLAGVVVSLVLFTLTWLFYPRKPVGGINGDRRRALNGPPEGDTQLELEELPRAVDSTTDASGLLQNLQGTSINADNVEVSPL